MMVFLRFIFQPIWQDGWNAGVEFERLRQQKEQDVQGN